MLYDGDRDALCTRARVVQVLTRSGGTRRGPMFLPRSCQSIARWSLLGCTALCCLLGGATFADDTSTASDVSLESYYRALLEPCMADGVISPAERQTILSIASKSLAKSE